MIFGKELYNLVISQELSFQFMLSSASTSSAMLSLSLTHSLCLNHTSAIKGTLLNDRGRKLIIILNCLCLENKNTICSFSETQALTSIETGTGISRRNFIPQFMFQHCLLSS